MGARAAFGGALVFFLATRALLHLGITPFFEGDSYKYLGGADALWAGRELPPLFRDLAVTGGALHAVPGYAWFLVGVWKICGRMTLPGVLIAQSLVALLGFLAAADLARRWIGPWTAVVVFTALAVSPTLAWLEHLLMPDQLAVPLFWLAVWLVVAAPFRSATGARAAANGAVSGLILAAVVLLRTASQIFAPLLFAVPFCTRSDWRSRASWIVGCGAAMLLGLTPWMLHNHRYHGAYRVSASTGRNIYFSALWSNTLDRERLAEQSGIPNGSSVSSSFAISDETLRRLLGQGLSFAEADTEMARLALEAYRAKPLSAIVAERYALMRGLFVESSSGPGSWLKPLRPNVNWVLENQFYAAPWRTWVEGRLKYPFSTEAVAAQDRALRPRGVVQELYIWWTRLLTLDGVPLLCLYVATMPMLALLPQSRACAFWCFAAPPVAFLAVFAVVGAPLYRYQAGLHPFMLGTAALGASAAFATLRVAWPSVRRRLVAD